jgi:hypothetical protein
MKKGLNKKGALELSIGTIVVLVLAMAMLIMGLILVQNIFSGGTDAIDKINNEVLKGIDDMFSDSDAKIVIYPTSRKFTLEQGSKGDGFAFSIRNTELDDIDLTYLIEVDPSFDIESKCKASFESVNRWLDVDTGSFTIAGSSKLDLPELVTFTIPDNAPSCTIPFRVNVNDNQGSYASGSVRVTIEAR